MWLAARRVYDIPASSTPEYPFLLYRIEVYDIPTPTASLKVYNVRVYAIFTSWSSTPLLPQRQLRSRTPRRHSRMWLAAVQELSSSMWLHAYHAP